MTSPKRIVVVGGVAAGASAAAKARRMNEDVEVILFEAGPYISFANCGLPYYVGGEISDRKRLFVTTAERFGRRYNLDIRAGTRVTAVDRRRKTVTAQAGNGVTGEVAYDRLVLATGSVGVVPPIKGLDRPNIFTVRTVPDVDAITEFLAGMSPSGREAVDTKAAVGSPARAVVIGGGYVGLETAEQLLRRGLKVTLVEMADQLMLTLDREMAGPLRTTLVKEGCEVILGDRVREIVETDGHTTAVTESGRQHPFDLGILAVGSRPNVELARAADVALGKTGAIRVDELQRTSDPAVYAAGDNSETFHLVLGRPVNIPLAGPATKTGRVAGANAAMDLAGVADEDSSRLRFRGVLGTAVVRVCDTVAGVTGLTESQARREGVEVGVTYMPGPSHASYYPGTQWMLIKLLYAVKDGRLLGAQVVGGEGVDKRIDVLATALVAGLTVADLEHLDLCYAPPFGSARDPVIGSGFAAANEQRGQMPVVTPDELLDELAGKTPPVLIDDRTQGEYDRAHLEGAIHIHVDDLRDRLDEVPTDTPVVIYCASGYRSYLGQRMLMNHGWTNVRNLLGGDMLFRQTATARNADDA